ncbi:MAG: ferric reductase-like transmembrane domain-containing protein [Acidimicrobiales bacterium]|nr:ferric reductase-like transmembrane domain-containing protein [Acidimicrobiales bacterium]
MFKRIIANFNPNKLSWKTVAERFAGSPRDWIPQTPALRAPRISRSWMGPLLITLSALVGWLAFVGAEGEDGSVTFGLFIGSVSIVLMAWSFVLSLRPRILEPVFGGLDKMYKSHRWSGTLAVVAMYLHTSVEAEIEGGIEGASESLADAAEDLAGTGQTFLYILVGLSLIRWIPYRYWRLTHKFLGIPFLFASFHFFTSEKPYANDSGWGWYFGAIMVLGALAYFGRVVGYDMMIQGKHYQVAEVTRYGKITELGLAPVGGKLKHHPAQFATIKLQIKGMSEPHTFTIASAPHEPNLRFFIRDLGDWTGRLQEMDLLGADVYVEGPFGEFAPMPKKPAPTYWIAGGVGITPFLSMTETLSPVELDDRPVLMYCVRSREDAMAFAALERAAADGRIRLEWFESSAGRRFNSTTFAELVAGKNLQGAHLAACGPSGLIQTVKNVAAEWGVSYVETESFDFRGGFGPDLSLTVEELIGRSGEK